jgi:hypothetical protein
MFNTFMHIAIIIMMLFLIYLCIIAIIMTTSDFIEKRKYKNSLKEENERLKEEIEKLKSSIEILGRLP